MSDFGVKFGCKPCPANAHNTFISGNLRLSVLTPNLIRCEYSPGGTFRDLPTQTVACRDLGETDATFAADKTGALVTTGAAEFIFSPEGRPQSVIFPDGREVKDFRSGNLKGTYRTLDMADGDRIVGSGKIRLGDGVVSKNGVALLDDSASLSLFENGEAGREAGGKDYSDIYVFAYGRDYRAAVSDFYRLTGCPPLLPKFVFGNWWSRYRAYTQNEYLELMAKFREKNIPLTVATIDMDWHWVDVAKRFGREASVPKRDLRPIDKFKANFTGSGWTGYSWNTELFPDYRAFLNELRDSGLHITMNVHPSDGVRCFEDQYADFARFMGIDPDTKEPVGFDITDPKFIEGYFRYLHHPYEADGVDFWWIDWQQGTRSKVPGLDPLWALNHYHSLDMLSRGKRPLILSRFAGAGSHRYPLGFSGDTIANWRSLKYQPYFTATAANVGYTRWSHDIGGHQLGVHDDELYIRWCQLGVFSPVMRLHSTRNEFMGKEPWNYGGEAERIVSDFMRLRHRLIPYIYTADRQTSLGGRALCEPMYYSCPDAEEAYTCPNEYFFGPELIAAPITGKIGKSGMACSRVFLPEGRWTDFFTGMIYGGGRVVDMYRGTESFPLLARAGAIIPLSDDMTPACDYSESLTLRIYRGKGEYVLYNDDGESVDYKSGAYYENKFTVSEKDGGAEFIIHPATGDISLARSRTYTLEFADIVSADARVNINGKFAKFDKTENGFVRIVIGNVRPDETVRVVLKNAVFSVNPTVREQLAKLFTRASGSNLKKMLLYTRALDGKLPLRAVPDADIRGAVREITAVCTK